jgi:hypothetical protein
MNGRTELVGQWLFKDGKIVGDETENRIWDLVRNHLTRLGDRECGWVVLYRNQPDGSYWELSLPQGEMQGGGPAKLASLEAHEVLQLYPELGLYSAE